MKQLLVLACLAMAGCQSSTAIEQAIGVAEDDNAILCIRAKVDGYLTDSGVDYTRIELPANLNLGTLTPETAQALAQIAARLGC